MTECNTSNVSGEELVDESLVQSGDQLYYDWTTQDLGEPSHDKVNDLYLVTVKTNQSGFDPLTKEEIFEESKLRAVRHLVGYFNKIPSQQDIREVAAASRADEWYLDARPGSKIKVLVEVPIALFDESFVDGIPQPEFELPPLPSEPNITAGVNFEGLLPIPRDGIFKSGAEKLKEDDILTTEFKISARKQRAQEVDYVGDDFFSDVESVLPKIDDLNGLFSEVLNKVSPSSLLQTLLDCIISGLPEIPIGSLFEVPEFDPPSIELFLLPTTDFLGFIRALIEEVIEGIILETLKFFVKMVLDLTMKFCEDILGALPSFGGTNTEGIAEELSNNLPVDFPEIQVDEIEKLLEELNKRLTPEEYCSLLLGRPTNGVIETIKDIFRDFPEIANRFNNDVDAVLTLLSSAGNILGNVAVLERCEAREEAVLEPCAGPEDFRAMQRELYRAKVDAGLITDQDMEELLDRTNAISANVFSSIQSIVRANSIVPNVQNVINEKLQNLQFQNPSQEQDVFDISVNALFGSFEDLMDKEMKQYFPGVIKRIKQKEAEDPFSSEILKYKSEFTPVNTNELNVISEKYDLEQFDPSEDAQLMRNLFDNKLFLQDKPFGNFPNNFSRNRKSFVDIEAIKNAAAQEYKKAPLSQRATCTTDNSIGLFERTMLKYLSKVFARLVITEFGLGSFIASSTYDFGQLVENEGFLGFLMDLIKREYSKIDPFVFGTLEVKEKDIQEEAEYVVEQLNKLFNGVLQEGINRVSMEPADSLKEEDIIILLSIYSEQSFSERFNNVKRDEVTVSVDRFGKTKQSIVRTIHSLLKIDSDFGSET